MGYYGNIIKKVKKFIALNTQEAGFPGKHGSLNGFF
jgi:hypothetical protein